jgi:hypothetical protein
MADFTIQKNKTLAKIVADDELTPVAAGITIPFLVPMAGHEGARAVYDYRSSAEGRITTTDRQHADDQEEKFRDYGAYLSIVDGLGGDNTDKESGEDTKYTDVAGLRRMPNQDPERMTTKIGKRSRPNG